MKYNHQIKTKGNYTHIHTHALCNHVQVLQIIIYTQQKYTLHIGPYIDPYGPIVLQHTYLKLTDKTMAHALLTEYIPRLVKLQEKPRASKKLKERDKNNKHYQNRINVHNKQMLLRLHTYLISRKKINNASLHHQDGI